jgi:hypothetical protein
VCARAQEAKGGWKGVCGGGATHTRHPPQLFIITFGSGKFNLGISFFQSRMNQSYVTQFGGSAISWDSKDPLPPIIEPQRSVFANGVVACGTMSSEAVAVVPVVAAHPKGRVVLPIHVVPIRCVYCVVSVARERERMSLEKECKKGTERHCGILRG